jgi:hypothetical protein
MKLTDLLKEQGNPEENNIIDELQMLVDRWNEPNYMGGLESCEKSNQYMLDVVERIEELKNPLPSPDEDEEEEFHIDRPDLTDLQERKLKRFIKKIIKQ